jgi:hypothetical protein
MKKQWVLYYQGIETFISGKDRAAPFRLRTMLRKPGSLFAKNWHKILPGEPPSLRQGIPGPRDEHGRLNVHCSNILELSAPDNCSGFHDYASSKKKI